MNIHENPIIIHENPINIHDHQMNIGFNCHTGFLEKKTEAYRWQQIKSDD